MYTHNEIRHEGPAPVPTQGAIWDRAWLLLGARPAQSERERAEKQAGRIVAKQARDAAKGERDVVRGNARGFAELASVARAHVKSERDAAKAARDADAAQWARFATAPAFRDAFSPTGRVRAGWALVRGVPCYLPAALAALASFRGIDGDSPAEEVAQAAE